MQSVAHCELFLQTKLSKEFRSQWLSLKRSKKNIVGWSDSFYLRYRGPYNVDKEVRINFCARMKETLEIKSKEKSFLGHFYPWITLSWSIGNISNILHNSVIKTARESHRLILWLHSEQIWKEIYSWKDCWSVNLHQNIFWL